jgi:aldehyde dehydrogenase (NAD+)
VNEKQFDEIVAAIERGRSEGGEVIAGGGRADETGYVIEPTVFEGVRDDAFLSCEEVFGPVTSLYRIGDLDEGPPAARMRSSSASPRQSSRRSLEAAQRFANEAEAGLLHVNSQTAGAEVHVPFGGIKASGFGPHEQGRAALEFYTEVVTVYQDV